MKSLSGCLHVDTNFSGVCDKVRPHSDIIQIFCNMIHDPWFP